MHGRKGHNARPKIPQMERDVDSWQWDGGEASFKFYVPFRLLLGLRTLEALCYDIAQHFPNFLDAKNFRQLGKVNIMHGNTTLKHTMATSIF